MSSRRISASESLFGWLPISTSTISSKLSSQNGRFMLSGEMTSAVSWKAGAYSRWTSSRSMCACGFLSRMRLRISATAQDLPVPVVPRTAKCLPSSSSILTIAGMRGVLLDAADADRGVLVAGIGHRQLVLAGAKDEVAERRIGRDAAPEARRPAVSRSWAVRR